MNLRRRQVNGAPVPSLYGGDVDEVVFEVSYHTNQALSFAVNTSHFFQQVFIHLFFFL